MQNKFKIEGDTTIIYIINKKGEHFETLIDTEDLEKVSNYSKSWHVKWNEDTQSYYARMTKYLSITNGKIKHKIAYMHRAILDLEVFNEDVDHYNHDTLDNRKENLIIKSRTLNGQNRNGKNKNNTSGYRNVSKVGKWWYVQLQIDGKNTLLHKFPLNKLEEAGYYAELMREKYYGIFQGTKII